MAHQAFVAVENLTKHHRSRANDVAAVAGISFDVGKGDFFTLLGPSGCGKTTTLRCIAGLEKIDGGRITLDGTLLASATKFLPPHKRGLGMVFQSYAIWPHMTVYQNVEFPLDVGAKRFSKTERRDRVEAALSMVELSGLEGRMATTLSGGQQQRLALARAIVGEPRVLLFDEPLSNLDARLRDRMRGDLKSLLVRLGITTIYVTHDQLEALSMSSTVAVMKDGRIVQVGSPREVYERPKTPFVAEFLGGGNFLDGIIRDVTESQGARVLTALGTVELSNDGTKRAVDDRTLIAVRPENIVVSAVDMPGPNVFQLAIEDATYRGESVEIRLRAEGVVLIARQHSRIELEVGRTVYVQLPPEMLIAVGERGPVAEEPTEIGARTQALADATER